MLTSRSAHGACKLEKLINMKEYTFYSRDLPASPCYEQKERLDETIPEDTVSELTAPDSPSMVDPEEFFYNQQWSLINTRSLIIFISAVLSHFPGVSLNLFDNHQLNYQLFILNSI